MRPSGVQIWQILCSCSTVRFWTWIERLRWSGNHESYISKPSRIVALTLPCPFHHIINRTMTAVICSTHLAIYVAQALSCMQYSSTDKLMILCSLGAGEHCLLLSLHSVHLQVIQGLQTDSVENILVHCTITAKTLTCWTHVVFACWKMIMAPTMLKLPCIWLQMAHFWDSIL